jgi:hypothetical protein
VPSARAARTSGRSTARIWIEYDGAQWFSAGRGIPISEGQFRRIGDYRGHAVYAAANGEADTIYVESQPGWVAPFRK